MTLFNASGAVALISPGWSPPDEFDEFRIVRSLGHGAMGQVYLAHDQLLDRPVAVKFVHPTPDPAARARVLEEARAIARLQHPNVVAIYRVAELAGHPYLVSEYAHGRPLNELTRPMPSRRVLDLALDLTRGLAAAHRRGVLHRDVKPANAILTDDGCAKLLDFGLAQITETTEIDDASEFAATQDQTVPSEHRDRIRRTAPIDLVSDQTRPLQRFQGASQPVNGPGLVPQLIGTPFYMAPEIWRGEASTRRSDLYSLGILLYELLHGTAPHRDVAIAELGDTVQQCDIPRLGDVAPGVEPALAAIVDRLVQRDPHSRFASADALLAALEECAAPPAQVADPTGNPYRGLAAFESANAALFFGRGSEIRELVDRVRIEPFVVVGGDSGTGKSSLCRAGVLPWLAEHGGWSCAEVVPGRRPVRALAAALAPWAGIGESALATLLGDSPDAIARAIRKHIVAGEPPSAGRTPPRRLLLFVDQLEELLTQADPEEARAVAIAIAALAVRSPSVRVLATARSDFLSRLAMLPELGDEMARGLYFLRPLGGEQIREAIIRPAAAKGVTYESEALVDALVAQTEHSPGGLPLLQFTLAELWDARDARTRTIVASSLAALGGVAGALSRHADRVLAGLRTAEQDGARRILLRLVTAQRTRIRRTQDELVADDASSAALEVLVRGRVLVASNAQDGAYEIAHEALLTGWSTLQDWLRHDAANHAVRERVEHAATAWDRMGRARDLLWGRRQLAEARVLDRDWLAPRELAFLAAAGRAIRWRRVAVAAASAALVVAAVLVGAAIHARARGELDALVADQVGAAAEAQHKARAIAAERDTARTRALALFDAYRWAEGEDAWPAVEALGVREDRQYRTAAAHLETSLQLDPTRSGARSRLTELTFERMVRAEYDHHYDLVEELGSRLIAANPTRYRAQLDAPAEVAITASPAGTLVWAERAGEARQLLGHAPLPPVILAPGSLVLVFEAPGHVAARLPLLIARGERIAPAIALPTAATAPPDMVYVPPGRFLFGVDGSNARVLFNTVPLHEVSTAGYFIGRHEVTFGEWIAYLDDLSPAERRRRTPRGSVNVSAVTLTELAPRSWQLRLTPTAHTYVAETGQRLRYEGRTRRADQDWTRFPVSAISYEDAVAYAAWLDATRRVPGARLCDEYEWERAARGADARTFPGGAELEPGDADVDATYGREPLAFGPDEVGAHPGSRSPVGADDMAGNVWEWTRSVQNPGAPALRGGCWYQNALAAHSANREAGEPTQRDPLVGLRICATPQ
jgi:serine/threonine protein kinase/formylglycine-generating enzyme required for sulfatase activity